MSALQELQLLEIMCSCFQEQSRDTVRQLMFSALFSLQGNQADESRMGLLGKLVSMAIAVGRVPILECSATWLQVCVHHTALLCSPNSDKPCETILSLLTASVCLTENAPRVLCAPGAASGRRLLQHDARLGVHFAEHPQCKSPLLLPVHYCCHHPLQPHIR